MRMLDDPRPPEETPSVLGDTERALARADATACRDAREFLAPSQAALTASVFYAYLTLYDQNRCSITSDS